MENQDFTKKLDVILKKVSNCIPLTNEEEKLRTEILNKLFDGKKSFQKKFETKTGDEIRKTDASPELKKPVRTGSNTEGPLPKQRDKEGGYDSKADVKERNTTVPESAQTPAPIRDEKLSDQKEEKTPKEDVSGKVKESYTDPKTSDTDEKEFENPNYEEDRVGRYTEHGHPKGSIQIQPKDLVVKNLNNGGKLVGMVLKVYEAENDQKVFLVKWSCGTQGHVRSTDVELLKVEGQKPSRKEEEKISPPVKKAAFPQHVHLHVHAHDGKDPMAEDGTQPGDMPMDTPGTMPMDKPGVKTPVVPTGKAPEVVPPVQGGEVAPDESGAGDQPLSTEPPEGFIEEIVQGLLETTDVDEQTATEMAQSIWEEIAASHGSKPTDEATEAPVEPGTEPVKPEAKKPETDKPEEDKGKKKVPFPPVKDDTKKGILSSVILPIATEALGVGAGVLGGDLAAEALLHPKKPKKPKMPKSPSIDMTANTPVGDTQKGIAGSAAGAGAGVLAGGAAGRQIGELVGSLVGRKKPGGVIGEVLGAGAGALAGGVLGHKEEESLSSKKSVEKGEKPPSAWLDNCVESVKDNPDVDDPYAVCSATYNKMTDKCVKAEDGTYFLKITPEDLDADCPSCAKRMRDNRVKFLKFTFTENPIQKEN